MPTPTDWEEYEAVSSPKKVDAGEWDGYERIPADDTKPKAIPAGLDRSPDMTIPRMEPPGGGYTVAPVIPNATSIGPIPRDMEAPLTEPTIHIPKFQIDKDSNPFVAAGKEAVNLITGVPEFLSSPAGIGSVGAGMAAPVVTAAAFTADMLHSLGKQIRETYKNWDSMSNAQKAVAVTDIAGTGAFAALTGTHAVKGAAGALERPAIPELPSVTGNDLPMPEGYNPRPVPQLPRVEVPETPAEPQKGMPAIEEIRNAGAKTKEDIRKLYPQLNREQAAQLRNQAWGEPAAPIVPPEAPAAAAPIEPKPVTPPPATNEQLASEATQGKFSVTPEAESLIQDILGQPSRDSRDAETTKAPEPAISDRITQAIPAEPSSVAEPAAPEAPAAPVAPRPKRRDSIFDRETDIVGPDILSWINENGLLLSKSAARKLWGKEKFTKNKSQWDDAVTMQKPHHGMAIYGNKFASSPNQIADTAFKSGLIDEPSVNKLWEAIDSASRKRAGAFKGQERENTALAAEITEHDNWNKAIKEGGKEVNSDDLGLGDTLKLGEHEVKVTHIDPDSGDVTVDGGKQFGTKVIPQGETIKVDKITTKPFGEDFTGAEPEAPKANAPLERAMEIEKTFGLDPADAHFFNIALDEVAKNPAKWTTLAEGVQKEALRASVKGGGSLSKTGDLKLSKQIADKYLSEAPKLRPGEKGTGDLLQGEDAPFNLSGETQVDASRVAAEKAKAEQIKREAAELQAKQQPGLFDSPAISKAEQWANDKLKGGGTSSGPDVLAAYAVKGAITIARGIKDFSEWSADMIRQLGDAVKPHLQDIWNKVGGTSEAVRKFTDDILNPDLTINNNHSNAAGLGVKSIADLDALAAVRDKLNSTKDELFKAAENDPSKRNQAFSMGMRMQYPREAVEVATNIGGWVEGGGSLKTKLGPRPLDWHNNPEVQAWLRKNADRLKISLPDDFPKEPGSAGLAKNVRNVSGATGEGGFVKIPSLREITDKILGGDSKEKLDAFSRWRDNHTTPKTMAASEASGNAINRYAAAAHAAPLVAKSMAMDVLGANARNVKFRQKLGAVLVEDRLRAIKDGFVKAAQAAKTQAEKGNLLAQANEVNTLVGSGKAFASEADFKAALKDPEIRASIAKHKATIQANATKFHTETGGNLAGPGVNTGAFVNLEALHEDKPEMVFSRGGTKGDYSQPFKKKSVFNQQAAGTGKNYELDYNRLAERMIRGNFQEYAKRQMYDQLQKDGLAKILPPNAPNPNIDGQPSIKFQIVRRGNQTENLWVRKNIASEVRQALNLDGPLSDTAIAKVASLVNKLQMSLATDAVYHMANIMSAIAGKQGGKNIWTDIARKVPGVNIIDAGIRIGAKARQVLADDPEIVKAMAEISQIGASRPEHAEAGRAGRMIALLDKSARLIRNDMYDNLVQRGIITASEGGRREFINQVGQYNPRLMGTLDRIFKEAGISPFIVAGKTFNRAAVRTTTLDPGYKAATRTAAVQGRVIEGLGVVATLVAIPALMNSLTTGKPNGRKGVQFGQIDTGKSDSKGNPIVVDPAQWIGLRRGLRMTGVNALINGMRAHKPGREIAKDAGTDIIGAITHPWAGPVVQAPTIFATGHNTSGYAESSDPNNYVENFKSALKSINPVVHAFFSKNEDTLTGRAANAGKSFGGAVGIKTAQAQSSQQEVQNRARSWGLSSDIPKVKTAFEQREKEKFPPSIYKPLKEAVGLEDSPKIIQSVKDLLAVEPDQKARDKRKKEILREFNPFTKSPDSYDVKIKPFATRDKVFESAFIKSLDAEGKESYRQSVRDQVKAYRTLTQALYNKASDPKDTPEAYRTR